MSHALATVRDASHRLLASPQGPFALLAVLGLAAIVFPPAALGVAAIAWSRRDELGAGAARWFAADRGWYLWVPVAVVLALSLAKAGNMAPDDLSRHLTAYHHGFDYSGFYLYTDARLPSVSLWLGFEWLAGHLHAAVGLFWATQIVQALAFGWAAALLSKLFLDALGTHPERTLLAALAVTAVLCSVLLARLQAARPEAFLTLLALTALLCNSRGKALLWTLAMLAAQPLYWLAFIYAPAAVLLPAAGWKQRALVTALIAGAGAAFWTVVAGRQWLGFFPLLHEWAGNRVFLIGELHSIYHLLFLPGMLVLMVAAIALSRREDWARNLPVLLVLAYFIAPDQVRYATVASPLIGVLAMRGVARRPFTLSPLVRFMAVAAMGSLLVAELQGPGWDAQPAFRTMTGHERVLTVFDSATYFLPARFPGVRVAPAMDPGATERGVQEIGKRLVGERRLDCTALARYPDFTHLVERGLGHAPACLELQEMHRDWRLWRIKPAKETP